MIKHSIIYNKNYVIIIIKRYNHYQTLKVKSNATSKEIKESYYKMSKIYHPDVNKETNSEEKFKEIQAAYHVLGDEQRKLEYDNKGSYPGISKPTNSDPFNQNPINFNSAYRKKWKQHNENRKNYGGGGGASTSYNFDEYFRGHYGEQLRREQIRRHRALEYENFRRNSYQKTYRSAMDVDESVKTRPIGFLFFSIVFFLSIITYTTYLKAKEDALLHSNSLKFKNSNK